MVQSYRPNESKIVALLERDTIPKDRVVFELQLTYNFSVNKSGEITPNFPMLSDVLYESEFISQLWMLYNSHKQLVGVGDAYASKWATKVCTVTSCISSDKIFPTKIIFIFLKSL